MKLIFDYLNMLPWSWRCPADVDSIAEHWIEHSVSPEYRVFDFDAIGNARGWSLAWHRRINYSYGIATQYHSPSGVPGGRGWNRRLWKTVDDCEPEECEPEELVDRVFDRVIELLRQAAKAES